MKAINLIPEDLLERYAIEEDSGTIIIHEPAYVNIEVNKFFKVVKSEFTYDIENDKVSVSLWRKVHKIHITIL